MSTTPQRVALSRKAGWRMPENTFRVTRPGKWGNPFAVTRLPDGRYGVRLRPPLTDGNFMILTANASPVCNTKAEASAEAVACFRTLYYASGMDAAELRGKNLACWCAAGDSCHADFLILTANSPTPNP